MKKALLLLLATACWAHNVDYLPGNPMVLNYQPDGFVPQGSIRILPFANEDCQVQASASAPGTLVQVITQPGTFNPDVLVVLVVRVLRQPNGGSETVTVTGQWSATGASASKDPNCNGSGFISVQVTVNAANQPTSTANTPNSGSTGEPISTATGELFGYDQTPDLTLNGPLPLTFRRYYASYLAANKVSSALGANWMHNYDVRLALNGATATATLFRGKTVQFTQSESAWRLSSPEQRPYQLIAGSGGYQLLDPRSNTIYTFNSSGALTAIQDRNGNTISVTPGASGPTQVSDGLGRTLTFTYAGSNLSKVQDQAGRSVTFENSGGRLSAFTDANGKRTAFSYISAGGLNGLLTAATRPLGNQPLSQQYDSQGRVASQADALGNSVTLTYGSNGATVALPLGVSITHTHDTVANLMSAGDPTGARTTYTYDSSNRVTGITNRLGARSAITYDQASGLPATFTDELGSTIKYQYASSAAGGFTFYDLAGITFADGTSVALTRDAKGNITGVTDQAGKTWQAGYNSRGQIATLTNPAGGVNAYTYAADGTLSSIQLPSGDVTRRAYDSAGRPVLITQPDGSTIGFQYDNRDNVVNRTDERGIATAASYDDNNRLKSVTDALGGVATLGYDGDDRAVSTTDALGKITRRVYDAVSRLQSITDPTGVSVTYSYDKLNHRTAAVDATGKGFTFGKDAENRLTSLTDALSRTTTFTRDARGRVIGITSPNSERFSFTRDARGRVVSSTYPLNRTAQFSYDPRGLLVRSVAPGGAAVTLTRNELGLVTAATDPNGNAWASSFDSMGRMTSRTDPLGQATTFTYDSRQRVSAASMPQGSARFSYDAAGNLTGEIYSDGTALSFAYDANHRLTGGAGLALSYDAAGRISASNGLAIARDDAGRITAITYAPGKVVRYSYDNRGLLIEVRDWVGGVTAFAYDAAHQLTSIAYANGVTQSYTYDPDGNLGGIDTTKAASAISSVRLTRDALGRVTSAQRSAVNISSPADVYTPFAYDAASQSLAATYDPNGRVTGDQLLSYTWDLASRLSSYKGMAGAGSFTYDALGQRVGRTSGSGTQNYVLNYAIRYPSVSVVRSDAADQRYYIWLPDGMLLESIDAGSSARRFYHFDESGSTSALSDDTGAVTDTYAITPYGESVAHTGSTDNPFTFQGQYGAMQEGATSLYYMRARYFDSTAGRWISRDPVASLTPATINPYQYARGNPLRYHDPRGTQDFGAYTTWEQWQAGGGGVPWGAPSLDSQEDDTAPPDDPPADDEDPPDDSGKGPIGTPPAGAAIVPTPTPTPAPTLPPTPSPAPGPSPTPAPSPSPDPNPSDDKLTKGLFLVDIGAIGATAVLVLFILL